MKNLNIEQMSIEANILLSKLYKSVDPVDIVLLTAYINTYNYFLKEKVRIKKEKFENNIDFKIVNEYYSELSKNFDDSFTENFEIMWNLLISLKVKTKTLGYIYNYKKIDQNEFEEKLLDFFSSFFPNDSLFFKETIENNTFFKSGLVLNAAQFYVPYFDKNYIINTGKKLTWCTMCINVHELGHAKSEKALSNNFDLLKIKQKSVLEEVLSIYYEQKFFQYSIDLNYNFEEIKQFFNYLNSGRIDFLAVRISLILQTIKFVISRTKESRDSMLTSLSYLYGSIIASELIEEEQFDSLGVQQKLNYICNNIGLKKDSEILTDIGISKEKLGEAQAFKKLCRTLDFKLK